MHDAHAGPSGRAEDALCQILQAPSNWEWNEFMNRGLTVLRPASEALGPISCSFKAPGRSLESRCLEGLPACYCSRGHQIPTQAGRDSLQRRTLGTDAITDGSFFILFSGLEALPVPPCSGRPHTQVKGYFCYIFPPPPLTSPIP